MNTIQFFVRQDKYSEEIKNDFTPDIFEKFKKDNTLDLPLPPYVKETHDETIDVEFSKIECNDIPTTFDNVSINGNIYSIFKVDFNTKLGQYEVYTSHYLERDVFPLNEYAKQHLVGSNNRYEECCKNHVDVQKFISIFKNPDTIFSSYKDVYEYLKTKEDKEKGSMHLTSSDGAKWRIGGVSHSIVDLGKITPTKTFIL